MEKIGFWNHDLSGKSEDIKFFQDFVAIKGVFIPMALILTVSGNNLERKMTLKLNSGISDISFYFEKISITQFSSNIDNIRNFLKQKIISNKI